MFKRSILTGVMLAYLVSLACGFMVARIISRESYENYVTPTFKAMDLLELEEARSDLKTGGPAALAAYLHRLDHAFGGHHFLLSRDGMNVLTGKPETFLLPRANSTRFRGYVHGVFHLAQQSGDGQYWLAVLGSDNDTGPATWAYFAVCIVVTTGLLLFSLIYLVFPLRKIRDALGRFADGRMAMRIVSKRKDEIGQLAETFDRMAERIEQSFRTERLLLQDISHELRAPLARLSLAVHLARQEHSDEMLQQIELNVSKLSALVAEITEFHQKWSAVENSKPLEAVNLKQLVENAVQESMLEAASHGITIEARCAPVTLASARADLIGRAIENILRNAILHSASGSRIDISLTDDDQYAVIEVRDFGRGVSAELLERMFDPFYRGQQSNGEPGGLGLGLSIARRGVQWHRGALWAENASPGLRLIARFPTGKMLPHQTLKNS